jgi:hypothetical protein
MTIYGDGFFILKTLDPSSEGHEYRLAYCEDISVIFGKYDDTKFDWNANSESLWKTFKACFMSSSENVARQRAEKMAALHGKETECGIMVIQTFRKKTWDELINGA